MKTLEQTIFDDILERLVPRAIFTALKNANAEYKILVDNDTILFDYENKKHFLISVQTEIYYNGEYVKIHGNKRNKIATDFFKIYPVEEILKLEKEFIEKIANENYNFEIEQVEMLRIFEDKIQPIFQDCQYKAKYDCYWGSKEALISFRCDISNPRDRYYTLYHKEFEVFFDGSTELFKIKITWSVGQQHSYNTEEMNNLTIQGVKEFCENIVNEVAEYKKISASIFEELQAEFDKENKLYNFVKNIFKDKENTIILKKKNSFIVIENGLKFSVGTGKRGKFYNTNISKVVDMIKNGYSQYVIMLSKDIDMFKDEELKSFNWIKV